MNGSLIATLWHTGLAVFVTAVGLWATYAFLRRSEDPKRSLAKLLLTVVVVGGTLGLIIFVSTSRQADEYFGPLAKAFILPIAIAVGCVILGVLWTSEISGTLLGPLLNSFTGGGEALEPRPYYSAVRAKRHRGQFVEAVAEVRRQLAQFPQDYEGVLLLAGLLAENLQDLPGAEIALRNFCEQPSAPPRQVFAALTQLADWQLKLAADADAARATFQQIIDRFPDTEMALQARQRLAHVTATAQSILAQHDGQAVPLPEGVQNLGLREPAAFAQPREIEPGQLAAAYVKQLEQHPHDTEAREKLAAIYATHFRRLDLAAMELEQLIGEPKHSARQVAQWLNQLASYQVELGADVATVCATLERIVEKFPGSPAAEVAQRRLARVNAEIRGRTATPSVTLGEYEQRAGLKYGRPKR